MKITAKLLAMAIALSGVTAAMADDDDENLKLAIHEVKVKMGHGMAFSDGMKAYSACLAEGDYDGSYSVWAALDGDRSRFYIVSPFNMWAEYDEEDDVSDDCWAKDEIRNGVFDHMAKWKTQYVERMNDWSGDNEGAKVVRLHNFRVDEGSDFRKVVGEITGILKDAKHEHMGTWYDVLGNGYWDADYFVVDHYDNFAAMDEDRKGVNDVLTEALGEENTSRIWDAFGDALEDENGYWTTMLVRRGGMGYSPEDD